MAYSPGMKVYTNNVIEIPGMGSNYTVKYKFICNNAYHEGTIATKQSASTYKWTPETDTFEPWFGSASRGELHIYVYPNGTTTMGFGDYTYTLILNNSVRPVISDVKIITRSGRNYNNKSLSGLTKVTISAKIKTLEGISQKVTFSNGVNSFTVNVNAGSGTTEILTQSFPVYNIPSGSEYTDVVYRVDSIDARGRSAQPVTITDRVYKYVKPIVDMHTSRNDEYTRIILSYNVTVQTTVAEKANTLVYLVAQVDINGTGGAEQSLDLLNLESPQMLPDTVASGESYIVRILAIDSVGEGTVLSTISAGDAPVMDIGEDGKTITFFGSSPENADEQTVQIGKLMGARAIFGENNIKYNYNRQELFHLGYDIFKDDNGVTHAVEKMVFGDDNIATGALSLAIGNNNEVTGDYSKAIGTSNIVTGVASNGFGSWTKVSGNNQTVVGSYNVEDTADKYAFIVGNGTSESARSNALAVCQNGDVEINNKSVNKRFAGEVGHWYNNSMVLLASTSNYTALPAFTSGSTLELASLITKNSNTKITVNRTGLYAFMLRTHVAPRSANLRAEIAPFIDGTRLAMYCSGMEAALAYTSTKIIPMILKLESGTTVEFYGKEIDGSNSIEVTLGDVMMYALDYEDKYK